MKWNYVIMNPPYSRNLHLKFLEKVIEVSDKVVTVQPVRWIEETVGPKKKTSAFNKYEDSIAKHIKELDIYSAEEAEKLFGAAFNFNIGIYVCDKDKDGYEIVNSSQRNNELIWPSETAKPKANPVQTSGS